MKDAACGSAEVDRAIFRSLQMFRLLEMGIAWRTLGLSTAHSGQVIQASASSSLNALKLAPEPVEKSHNIAAEALGILQIY